MIQFIERRLVRAIFRGMHHALRNGRGWRRIATAETSSRTRASEVVLAHEETCVFGNLRAAFTKLSMPAVNAR